jgi:predicted DNA-binding transcriptional regulator AlpA
MQQLQASSAAFLRLPDIIGTKGDPTANPPIPPKPALIPVSRTTWLDGVREGRYPQPTRALGRRITAWAASDIYDFIEKMRAAA